VAETDQIELAELVAGAVRALVDAQAALDEQARGRAEEYLHTPAGTLALPPVWYSFRDVAFELEMSASVRRHDEGSRLFCRTLNPVGVGLFGYQASSGMRVRMVLSRNGFIPVKPPDSNEEYPPSPS
jgi:hypothetical protein